MVFFINKENRTHVCSIRFSTEEYGWLVRYCEKNDVSLSSVVRKSVKMYRSALASKAKRKNNEE
jgi:hypothetical protein